MGQNSTTDSQLNKIGKRLFKEQWIGVHPVDVKPKKIMPHLITSRGMHYGIINVDGSSQPGSHWQSVIYDGKTRHWWIWDSFGRKSSKLIPKFIKTIGSDYIDININGSNQKNSEESCGQKSIAMLLFIKKYGLKSARKV